MNRSPVAKISARRLREEFAGKVPFSTISRQLTDLACTRPAKPQKRKAIRKRRPTVQHWNPVPGALDPRSRFTKDGRTLLFGKDMELLRLAVFFRCNGYCEQKSHASNCPDWIGWEDGELDHIKAKGLGGGWRDDTEKNTMWLSQPCHMEKHRAIQVAHGATR